MSETWVSLYELEALIGKENAYALSVARGGTGTYVPKRVSEDFLLARIVGEQALESLVEVFGGMRIVVPNGRKAKILKTSIIDRLEKGQNPAGIAMALGVTERYVRGLGMRYKNTLKQGSLLE